MVADVVAFDLFDAAADPLANPIIIIGGEQVAVALEHLLSERAHLLRPEPGIDAQVLERAIEAIDVLLHLKQAMAKAARHIEGAVAVDPTGIAEGNSHLALGYELAVEPGDALVGTYSHRPSRGETMPAPLHATPSPRQLAPASPVTAAAADTATVQPCRASSGRRPRTRPRGAAPRARWRGRLARPVSRPDGRS